MGRVVESFKINREGKGSSLLIKMAVFDMLHLKCQQDPSIEESR
jgi:hypothetical protein